MHHSLARLFAFSFLFLPALPSYGAIALVSGQFASAFSATSPAAVSLPSTPTVGNVIVAVCYKKGNSGGYSVSDNQSNTYTVNSSFTDPPGCADCTSLVKSTKASPVSVTNSARSFVAGGIAETSGSATGAICAVMISRA